MKGNTIRLATWNMGDGPDIARLHALEKLDDHGVDIIHLQEAGDRRRPIHEFVMDNPWAAYWGTVDGAPSVPILYSEELDVRHCYSRLAVDTRDVGWGAGPSRSKPKAVNVLMVNVNGTDLRTLNTHTIASATKRFHPKRRTHYRLHVEALTQMVKRRDNADVIAVGGDMNAGPDFHLLDPLRKIGMRQVNPHPTHGKRNIDHWWLAGGIVIGRGVLDMPGDHRAAWIDLQVKR